MAAGKQSADGMANSIAARTEYIRGNMDEILRKGLLTADMNARPEITSAFANASTAVIPVMDVTGLGDYDRVKGYPVGSMTVRQESYTLAFDRGIKIDVDSRDAIDTGGDATAASAAAFLTRQRIIPEVDACRFTQIFTKLKATDTANASDTNWTPHVVEEATAPTSANLLSKIGAGLDVIFEDMPDVSATIYMNSKYRSILRNSTEFTKVKNIGDAGRTLNLENNMIDEHRIVWVPKSRMYTALTMYDGYTNNETQGGYAEGASAQDIDFVIATPGSAQGVTVFAKPKFVSADQNQTKDADSYMYRLYHDVIIEKYSGTQGLYVHAGAASGGA